MASERLTVALERPDLSTARSVTVKRPLWKRGAGFHERTAIVHGRPLLAKWRVYASTPSFTSRCTMPTSLRPSSQTRKRATTIAPRWPSERNRIVGALLPAGSGGVGVDDERTTAVESDAVVALELAFFAVTSTRSRWPTSAVRTP